MSRDFSDEELVMGRCVSVFFVERRVSVRINGGYEEVEFGWNRMKCGRE